MELKYRDTQTQVKHKILSSYLGRWGGIILNGLKRSAAKYGTLSHHFVYVDCFSYIGRYAGNKTALIKEQTTEQIVGSPIIGIRELDRLLPMATNYNIDLQVNAILIERDKQTFNALLETLADEGFKDRIRQTKNLSSLRPGEIAVINDDSTNLSQELLAYTNKKYTKSFYLIDPYGAEGIPYNFVKSIISGKNNDVMINFLYHDLHLKSGSIDVERNQKHVKHWTNAFSSDDWIEIARNKESNLIENELVELYHQTLTNMDTELTIKSIRLLFPDKDRPMFYLFLTTHDPTGALALNEILFQAKLTEYELRDQRRIAKKHPKQLSLFDTQDFLQDEQDDRPSTEECAEDIMNKFQGQTIKKREVYRGLANEEFFALEVDKAIKYLKKNKRVKHEGTRPNHETMIQFLR